MDPEKILDGLTSEAYKAVYTDDFWAEYASGYAVIRVNPDGTVDHINRAGFFTDTRDPSRTVYCATQPDLHKEER